MSGMSGIEELRRILGTRIIGRRDVLKADAALRLVRRAVTTAERPGARRLGAMAERLSVSVHDFQELRLLNDLRLAEVEVDDALRRRMEQLLGAEGGEVTTRLGLAHDAGPVDVRARLEAEHEHWQLLAGDLLTPPPVRRACDVLLRTLEGLYQDIRAR
jgi:hypothetical protein